MERVKTKKLVEMLNEIDPKGFQISRRHGLLKTTKCVYKRDKLIFLYDISEEFSFSLSDGYEKKEFLRMYAEEEWIIELAIS